MDISTQLLTNAAYGFPRGARRRLTPWVLAVVHQTANATSDAQGERNYANRVGSTGPSATFYVDRDGDVIQGVGDAYASWCAGDVKSPDRSIPTVDRMVTYRASHPSMVPLMNANEAVWDQIECCGSGPEPWTDAEFESAAQLIARRSRLTGLPIDRTTVLAHRDINTIDRASDPWPTDRREARLARLIARANQLLNPEEEMTPANLRIRPDTQWGHADLPAGHQLISPVDVLTRFPAGFGSTYDHDQVGLVVWGPLDLFGRDYRPMDVSGKQPPEEGRDVVAVVQGGEFGVAALALWSDLVNFVPTTAPAPTAPAPPAELAVTEAPDRRSVTVAIK